MKRITALAIILVIAISITACSGPTAEEKESEVSTNSGPTAEEESEVSTNDIELTVDNIEDYLAFNFDYDEVTREKALGITFGHTTLSFNSYSVRNGSFNNVSITLEIPLTNGWSVSSSDEAYDEADSETLTCTFRLPANGSYSESHDLIASMVFRDPNSQYINYRIKEVSGTFTE